MAKDPPEMSASSLEKGRGVVRKSYRQGRSASEAMLDLKVEVAESSLLDMAWVKWWYADFGSSPALKAQRADSLRRMKQGFFPDPEP